MECHRDGLFEEIRQDFPQVFVPRISPVEPPALQPYHFRDPSERKTLMVALNRFAFSEKKYEGYQPFKESALQYMRIFGQRFKIGKLNRTGLRYINLIPYTLESEALPMKRYFRFGLNSGSSELGEPSKLSLGYVLPTRGGNLTFRLECVASPEGKQAFAVDFDYSKEQNLCFGSVEEYLDESHTYTKKFFEDLISEEYRGFMRGDVIE